MQCTSLKKYTMYLDQYVLWLLLFIPEEASDPVCFGFSSKLHLKDLKEYFKMFGTVQKFNIVKNKNYGFVTFQQATSAQTAYDAGDIVDELGESYHEISGISVSCKLQSSPQIPASQVGTLRGSQTIEN